MKESEYSYDECLRRLEESIPEYIKKIGRFQWENEKWYVSRIDLAADYDTCQVDGTYPIKERYHVTNVRTGKTIIVGNVCIDRISNQKITLWYSGWLRRRERLERNRNMLEGTNEILRASDEGKLPIHISAKGIKRLKQARQRICDFKNPMRRDIELYNFYVSKIRKALAS